MAVNLSPIGGGAAQFFDNSGDPLSGGKIFTYAAGTTTPQSSYTSSSGATPHSNPIILDAAGRVPSGEIWLTNGSSYKFLIKTSADVQIGSYDNINGINSSFATDAEQVGYTPPFTGGALTNVELKLAQTVSVKDFGAVGNGVADDTAAIQAALTYAGTQKCAVYVPATPNGYVITAALTMAANTTIFGDGYGSLINQVTANLNAINTANMCTVSGLRVKVADGTNTAFCVCVSAVSVKNVTIENNYLEPGDLGGCGVYISSVQQSTVRNNRIYGGKWSSGASYAASASDIILYSFSASERHIIEGNYCLSNNSQGMFIDALGYDGDIIVSNNICVTLDPTTCTPAGAWSLVATGGVRRHGIVIGYNSSSVSGPRCVINGNLCRNTRWTGIYKQGVSAGAVSITNNLCDLNGYDTTSTLSGGIYVIQSGYEFVNGNTVTNFQNTTSATGGITVNATTTPTVPSTISNNFIRGSLGRGITASTNTALLQISKNTLVSNANSDLEILCNAGLATIGGHNIENNRIFRTSGTSISGIVIDPQSSTRTFTVKNNTLRGNDNTTVAAQNAGVYLTQASSTIQLLNNNIVNFYYGVYSTAYYTGGRMINVLYERNVIENCAVGFAVSATSAVQTVPLVDNRFVNTATLTSAPLGFVAGRVVQRIGDLLLWQTTAAPTLGTWAVGDRSMNSTPAVGQPKSWVCTVAGAPGTWVSEGNL